MLGILTVLITSVTFWLASLKSVFNLVYNFIWSENCQSVMKKKFWSRPRLSRAGFIEMPAHSPSSTFLWVELPWVFQSQNRWNGLFSRNSYHLFDCQHFAHCTMHLIQDLQTALELSIPFSVLKKKKENLSFINRYTTALLEDGLQNICFWVLGRRRGKYSCC